MTNIIIEGTSVPPKQILLIDNKEYVGTACINPTFIDLKFPREKQLITIKMFKEYKGTEGTGRSIYF